MAPLLDTHDLTVTFGVVRANDRVYIGVQAGAFAGLIGPNEAGKTTFIDVLTGYVPSTGRVMFDGNDIQGMPAHDRARRGLVRTFQSLELFEDLSVRDNVLAAAEPSRWYAAFLDLLHLYRPSADVESRVDWALDLMGLGDSGDRLPTDLSHGQRKPVGVARALASSPKLVLLDESARQHDGTPTGSVPVTAMP